MLSCSARLSKIGCCKTLASNKFLQALRNVFLLWLNPVFTSSKNDALLLQQAGCFALVLEKIPAMLAKEVSESLAIPTIGIGAGKYCDGQVLVMHDMLGINTTFKPRFLRQYLNIGEQATRAVQQYISDIKSSDFPNDSEAY